MTETVDDRLAAALGVEVTDGETLDGGKVGTVRRVDLADGRRVVAKTGDTPLTVEARMLDHLGRNGLPVPEVHYASDALLCLEYVSGDGDLTRAAERDVARHLSTIHAQTADRYGFSFDSLSGPYRQPNPRTGDWPTFFAEHRLRHLARAARDEGTLSPKDFARVDQVAAVADRLLPARPPAALLHGDVWAENLVVENDRVRAFLDPAVSYGHAEVELAYADFVNLGEAFFEAYDAETDGIEDAFWNRRRHVYALYPILEHVRFFDTDAFREELTDRLDSLGF